MTDRLVIVGAGGHGREALAVARSVNQAGSRWHSVAFVDDGPIDSDRLERIEAECLGSVDILIASGDEHVISVGDPAIRESIAQRIGGQAPAVSLIDPSAWIGDDVDFGDGVLIYPTAVCTTNIRIGRHSHVNCGAVISHDCIVGDFVSISPGVRLNGSVTIDDGAFLGTGAIVLPGCRIGQGAVVGAGAVVVEDVPAGSTVMGVPAR